MGQVCANATAHVTGLGSPVPFGASRTTSDEPEWSQNSRHLLPMTASRKQVGVADRVLSDPTGHIKTRRPPLPFQPLRRFESSLHKPFSTVSGMKPMSRVEALTGWDIDRTGTSEAPNYRFKINSRRRLTAG